MAGIARPLLGDAVAKGSVLLVALFPTAFVLTAPQSDALFLAVSAGAVLAANHRRPWLAGVCAAAAVATRLVGIALLPALALALWPRRSSVRKFTNLLPLLAMPLSLIAYAVYLDQRFGDPLAFAHAQETFWLREVHPVGPLGGLWLGLSAGAHGAAELLLHLPRSGAEASGLPARDQVAFWNLAHALLLLAALGLTALAWKRLGAAMGLYSLASIALALFASPAYFPLASLPRYLLADFPLFLALAAVLRDRPRTRDRILYAFAAVGAAAAVGYSRKIWIA
jgi:hypothetical protein